MAVTGPSEWDKVVDTLAASTLILCLVFSVETVADGKVVASIVFILLSAGCGLLLHSRLSKRKSTHE